MGTTTYLKKFYDIFGIDPEGIGYKELYLIEDILAREEMQENGFFDGFSLQKREGIWWYQLTYRKGGYYHVVFGSSRKEALLKQLTYIMEDREVDVDEKEWFKEEIKKGLKEEEHE